MPGIPGTLPSKSCVILGRYRIRSVTGWYRERAGVPVLRQTWRNAPPLNPLVLPPRAYTSSDSRPLTSRNNCARNISCYSGICSHPSPVHHLRITCASVRGVRVLVSQSRRCSIVFIEICPVAPQELPQSYSSVSRVIPCLLTDCSYFSPKRLDP